jgi:hypothetical protein
MTSILGSLGTVGLAAAITAFLILGTKKGGKAQPLGWGVTLFLALIAGAAYKAAGPPFDLVSKLANDLIVQAGNVLPGYTMPGMALTLVAFLMFAKLSTRQVACCGIFGFYVASGAGGAWGIVAEKIALIAQSLAS